MSFLCWCCVFASCVSVWFCFVLNVLLLLFACVLCFEVMFVVVVVSVCFVMLCLYLLVCWLFFVSGLLVLFVAVLF